MFGYQWTSVPQGFQPHPEEAYASEETLSYEVFFFFFSKWIKEIITNWLINKSIFFFKKKQGITKNWRTNWRCEK